MNVNIKNLNLSVIMPAITKSGQLVCNDRVPSKEDKVEHASGLYLNLQRRTRRAVYRR